MPFQTMEMKFTYITQIFMFQSPKQAVPSIHVTC